jgi:hypothetical protein
MTASYQDSRPENGTVNPASPCRIYYFISPHSLYPAMPPLKVAPLHCHQSHKSTAAPILFETTVEILSPGPNIQVFYPAFMRHMPWRRMYSSGKWESWLTRWLWHIESYHSQLSWKRNYYEAVVSVSDTDTELGWLTIFHVTSVSKRAGILSRRAWVIISLGAGTSIHRCLDSG